MHNTMCCSGLAKHNRLTKHVRVRKNAGPVFLKAPSFLNPQMTRATSRNTAAQSEIRNARMEFWFAVPSPNTSHAKYSGSQTTADNGSQQQQITSDSVVTSDNESQQQQITSNSVVTSSKSFKSKRTNMDFFCNTRIADATVKVSHSHMPTKGAKTSTTAT